MMKGIQTTAAIIALIFVTVIVGTTFFAIWSEAAAVEDLLTLTKLILSWPVAAGGLAFGGAHAIAVALKRV